jgi:hypothetical protein
MEVTEPYNQNGHLPLLADEGDEWVQQRVDEGMGLKEAVAAYRERVASRAKRGEGA